MTSSVTNPLSIAIIGFGSQAQAWAANLSDSGHNVSIYLRNDSISAQNVKEKGLQLCSLDNFSSNPDEHDFVLLLTPDHTHFDVIQKYFRDINGLNIVLGHGYSHWKHQFETQLSQHQFFLLAPKAIASEVRSNYLDEKPLYAAVSTLKDESFQRLIFGLGIKKPILSSFEEEAIADLFSEQSLLCGLVPYAAKMSYEKLVEKNINPEIAFIECWHEVKLIADAMIKFGPKGLFEIISPNALLGAELFKNQHLNQDWEDKLEKSLQSIKNKDFIEYESQNDINVIRAKVLEFWEKSDIQKTFEKLDQSGQKESHEHTRY
jgi:ketol-acid reductoisomerase